MQVGEGSGDEANEAEEKKGEGAVAAAALGKEV